MHSPVERPVALTAGAEQGNRAGCVARGELGVALGLRAPRPTTPDDASSAWSPSSASRPWGSTASGPAAGRGRGRGRLLLGARRLLGRRARPWRGAPLSPPPGSESAIARAEGEQDGRQRGDRPAARGVRCGGPSSAAAAACGPAPAAAEAAGPRRRGAAGRDRRRGPGRLREAVGQRVDERAGGRPAFARVLGQPAVQHGVERPREIGPDARGVGRVGPRRAGGPGRPGRRPGRAACP